MSGTADLHMHSDCSDGALPPAALVRHVAARGVGTMALTDHDTVAGCESARAACIEAAIRFIAGVEVSCSWRGQAIHVIGLAPRLADPDLAAHLRAIRELRRDRILLIGERLADRKALPTRELVARLVSETEVPTRMHLARELVQAGLADSTADAFDRWLGRGTPGNVPIVWPALEVTVSTLAAAGAQIVLAHPHRYRLSSGALRALVDEFATLGGHALEISVAGMARHDFDRLAELARRRGLAGSCGSDFHDPAVAWNPPGRFAKLPADIEPVAARLAA